MTYVLKTASAANGKHRPRSWHIVLTPTRVPNAYRTYCGRTIIGDTIEDTPAAATCEVCYRNQATARERLPEDDGSTQPVEVLP